MSTKVRTVAVVVSLSLLSGCVAYVPYPEYSAAPYGGYGYRAAPVMPIPMFYGGWGYRGYGHHHRH